MEYNLPTPFLFNSSTLWIDTNLLVSWEVTGQMNCSADLTSTASNLTKLQKWSKKKLENIEEIFTEDKKKFISNGFYA